MKKPHKILFLDIDGVLNNSDLDDEINHRTIFNSWDQYHPKLTNNLRKVIRKYDLDVVVSSTWRQDFSKSEMNYILNQDFGLECILIDYTTTEYLDINYHERVEWNPTELPRNRGMQITQWLENTDLDVEFYIVVDDDIDAKYGHENNFIQTDGNKGFDEDAVGQFHKLMETLNV